MAHLEFEKPLVELEDRIRELKVYGVRDAGFEGELRRLEERVEHLQREIGDQFRPPAILRTMVRAGKLGKKTGEGFYRWVDGQPVAK